MAASTSRTRQTADGPSDPCPVTVLMPVFNGERHLADQVASILEQEAVSIRLVIIDDASTDESWALLTSLGENEPRITLRRHETNLGLIRTIGELLQYVATPYFSLSDQDDVWDAHKLALSVTELETTGASLVYSDVRVGDEAGRVIEHSYWASQSLRPTTSSDPLPFIFRNPAVGHTLVARRTVAVSAAHIPPDLRYHEPWIIAHAQNEGPIEFIGQALGTYRVHASNVVGPSRGSLAGRAARTVLSTEKLRRRQQTRAAAIRAVAQVFPDLQGLSTAMNSSGWQALRAFPAYMTSLIRHRKTLGWRVIVTEGGAFVLHSLIATSATRA